MTLSKKIQIVFVLCSVLVLSIYLSTVVYAPTSEDSALSASLTVNSFVDTSIDAGSLSFGSLDPATADNAATENPVTLTNTANSNTAVDVYLVNSQMTSGGNTIECPALSVHTSDAAGSSTAFNVDCSTYLTDSVVDSGYVENLAVSGSQAFYFWHDVPPGQAAGAYTATVVIHAVADGQAP